MIVVASRARSTLTVCLMNILYLFNRIHCVLFNASKNLCEFRVFLHSISMLFECSYTAEIERGRAASNSSHETTCAPIWWRTAAPNHEFIIYLINFSSFFSSSSHLFGLNFCLGKRQYTPTNMNKHARKTEKNKSEIQIFTWLRSGARQKNIMWMFHICCAWRTNKWIKKWFYFVAIEWN